MNNIVAAHIQRWLVLLLVQGCQKEPSVAMRQLLGVSATGYLWEMIGEIKSCQPEVKASTSDKRLRSYGHLKICMVSDPCWTYGYVFDTDNRKRRCLLISVQMPALKMFDNPAG